MATGSECRSTGATSLCFMRRANTLPWTRSATVRPVVLFLDLPYRTTERGVFPDAEGYLSDGAVQDIEDATCVVCPVHGYCLRCAMYLFCCSSRYYVMR